MNRTYRLVWNPTRQLWAIASELAACRRKAGRAPRSPAGRTVGPMGRHLTLPALLLATAAGVHASPSTPPATAQPSGGQVANGNGHIAQTATTTTVTQQSQRLAVNWKTFNVGSQATVDFVQPNASSVAINRIADTNGSQIYGHLNANGQVFLINPYGVVFGQGAQVNVGGLVASTLDLNDATATSSRLAFSGSGTLPLSLGIVKDRVPQSNPAARGRTLSSRRRTWAILDWPRSGHGSRMCRGSWWTWACVREWPADNVGQARIPVIVHMNDSTGDLTCPLRSSRRGSLLLRDQEPVPRNHVQSVASTLKSAIAMELRLSSWPVGDGQPGHGCSPVSGRCIRCLRPLLGRDRCGGDIAFNRVPERVL